MQSTDYEMTLLQNEEAQRAFIHLVKPMIQEAVTDAIPPEWMDAIAAFKQTQEKLQAVQAEITEIREKFITAEDARKIGQDIGAEIREPLRTSIDRHLRELSEEDEKSRRAFDVRIGEVNALVIEAQRTAAETDKKLATLEATSLQRFDQIERRLTRTENDVEKHVRSVANSVASMDTIVGKFVQEYEKLTKENARSIEDLQIARNRLEKRLEDTREDGLNLRGDVDGLRADIATKVTTTDLKVKDIDRQVTDMKEAQLAQRTDLIQLNTLFNEFQVSLKSAMWLVNTWGGRFVLTTIIALLVGSNLIN
jgi:hypothetical protein